MAAPGNLYPSVYTVDAHTTFPPPLPPKPTRFRKRTSVTQPLLYGLVALALCGMAVEACFIYSLYIKRTPSNADTSQISQGTGQQVADKPAPRPNPVEIPSKPLAHLTGSRKPAADGHMFWNDEGESEIHGMEYKDGSLTILKEGYYFVYSKIYFAETHSVSLSHSVVRITDRYPKEMVLIQSREYHPKLAKHSRTNSYLGGMFHLFVGDVIFVRVNNTEVLLSTSAENYFGAYMV
ncbi:hypothetical protein ACEWY4_003362 [Coilia grayii]|uniref:THD domain-containing protein n=1 Tax=Coilia grayii TaxID=363190 RepID=A0ABD1KRH3_9TELE